MWKSVSSRTRKDVLLPSSLEIIYCSKNKVSDLEDIWWIFMKSEKEEELSWNVLQYNCQGDRLYFLTNKCPLSKNVVFLYIFILLHNFPTSLMNMWNAFNFEFYQFIFLFYSKGILYTHYIWKRNGKKYVGKEIAILPIGMGDWLIWERFLVGS